MFERCVGTLNGPCPDSRCDATVRFGIYDVFVCPSCDQVRADMEKTSSLSVVTRNTNANDQAKSKNTKKHVPVKSSSKVSTRYGQSSDTNVSASLISGMKSTDQASSSKAAAGDLQTNRNDDTDSIDEDNEDADCCPHCLIQLNGKRQVRCDICSSSYHQKCTEMTSKVFDKFITSVTETGWVCSNCKQAARSSFRRLEAAIAQLAEELTVVKNEMSRFKNELHNIKPAPVPLSEQQGSTAGTNSSSSSNNNNNGFGADDEAKTTLIIHRTLNDAARRKRNVIISGLPESDTHDDRTEFLRLCEGHLSVKPSVAENACMRIGKQLPNVPRRLLVRLGSEDTADAVLRDARKLRSSSDTRNVFINPDLSPAAAALAYEARKKRRDSKLKRPQPNNCIMEAAHDGEEVNLPIIITGSLSSRAADAIITIATEFVDQPPIIESTTNAQSLSSPPRHNSPPNNRAPLAAQTSNSFRPGLARN